MPNGRGAKSRDANSSKGGGKLNKDDSQRATPGFLKAGSVKEWPARTGYTSESKHGASSHGTKISLP